MAYKIKSTSVQRALTALGQTINVARRKRRISVSEFASRTGVSERTIMRIEQGDPGVKIGTFAMALMVLGELKRFAELMDPASDDTALLFEETNLPVRIRSKVTWKKLKEKEINNDDESIEQREDGVGF